MPFITEELWRVTAIDRQEPMLALATWPSAQPYFTDAHEEVQWLIDLVSAVRSVRTEVNVPAGSLIQLALINPSEMMLKRAELWDSALNRLARISGTRTVQNAPAGAIQIVVGSDTVALELSGVIDLAAESARLTKELAKCDADIARVDAKLGNPNFVARAPEEVVEERKKSATRRQRARSRSPRRWSGCGPRPEIASLPILRSIQAPCVVLQSPKDISW